MTPLRLMTSNDVDILCRNVGASRCSNGRCEIVARRLAIVRRPSRFSESENENKQEYLSSFHSAMVKWSVHAVKAPAFAMA
jgi:hypothetical protein